MVECDSTVIDVRVQGLVGMAYIGHVYGFRVLCELVLQTLVDEIGMFSFVPNGS